MHSPKCGSLGSAFTLFSNDSDDRFPPAAYGTANGASSHGIPGSIVISPETAPDSSLLTGLCFDSQYCPKNRAMPRGSRARSQPCLGGLQPAPVLRHEQRSVWHKGLEWQVSTKGQTYPLPTAKHGIGIYWQDGGLPNGLPGLGCQGGTELPTIKRPRLGYLLLVEEPNFQNVVGNVWPSISLGPVGTGPGDLTIRWIPHRPHIITEATSTGLHSHRFNYLFHDNHVQALKMEQTVGIGTLQSPRGMWTIQTDD